MIDQIREEKIELLLIAGDLFHRQPLPSQTERVSQLFASIPDTEVVWMAGSHDYLREDSAYRKVKWTRMFMDFRVRTGSDQSGKAAYESVWMQL